MEWQAVVCSSKGVAVRLKGIKAIRQTSNWVWVRGKAQPESQNQANQNTTSVCKQATQTKNVVCGVKAR